MGLGDLRSISRRGWSKSADDLGNMSPGVLSPINTTFQNKITQYRNRANSNASGLSHTPSTPSSPVFPNYRHPFPSLKNVSPGTSPPRNSVDPPSSVSISVSAPSVESDSFERNGQTPPAHIHIRSHSFTPRLPSKLTPRFGPVSPKRKGSGASDREPLDKDVEHRDVDKFVNTGLGSPALIHRGAFPYGFAGGLKNLPQDPTVNAAVNNHNPARSTVLLAPPAIIQPTQADEDGENAKRSSQIVYHSGFINLQSNTPPTLLQYPANRLPHSSLTLTKGWKPFKLELKGSKLLFYKPPSDRNNGIKDLFPSGLVPVLGDEDASSGDDLDRRDPQTKDSTIGRKRRAYWGRKTHPDLVHSKGQVESGSLEALVHEAVFATTFPGASASINIEDKGNTESSDKQKEEWEGFASAVLLCLPSLVGSEKFETEFTRCCAYLVNGAQDDVREKEQARVGWLAGEYLRYWDSPVDLTRWEEWRAEIIPDVSAAIVRKTFSSAIPSSFSMQALFVPSPQIGSSSPNIGTFSPRPAEPSKMLSLAEAFGVSRDPLQSSEKFSQDLRANPVPSSVNQIPWAALEQEGLSRDVLLSLDARVIARSLCLFHRSILELTPENLTADLVIGTGRITAPTDDGHENPTSFKALFGSEEHPHWLTKLLLIQVLSADTSAGHVPNGSSLTPTFDERSVQTSRTRSRSEVISVWAQIGELCRLAGDECSWRAIEAALCSRPVARLEKAWKRTDIQALAAVESWVNPGPDGERASVNEPRVTPWGGDVMSRIEAETARASAGDGEEGWNVSSFQKIRHMFNDLRTAFSLCPRRTKVTDDEVGDDLQRMVLFWRRMFAGEGGGAIASKFSR
jgi:hypothetical protein